MSPFLKTVGTSRFLSSCSLFTNLPWARPRSTKLLPVAMLVSKSFTGGFGMAMKLPFKVLTFETPLLVLKSPLTSQPWKHSAVLLATKASRLQRLEVPRPRPLWTSPLLLAGRQVLFLGSPSSLCVEVCPGHHKVNISVRNRRRPAQARSPLERLPHD